MVCEYIFYYIKHNYNLTELIKGYDMMCKQICKLYFMGKLYRNLIYQTSPSSPFSLKFSISLSYASSQLKYNINSNSIKFNFKKQI